jgi:serine/threonine protein kinase
MPVALETVVEQLVHSGIVSSGKLDHFLPPKAFPKDGEDLLRELFKQNLLTKFQAQQIAAGKVKALTLGAYTLLDKIGAGGMGQVFKAHHRRMDRLVAIKMLPPSMTKDAAALARFEREVRAAAKLRHPNIVAADDAAEANGVHFLVMEYVEGQDLSSLVKKNGPLPVSQAVDYILQAARGLEFAHGKGVVHRDVKPPNLLLGKDGIVKVLDMGLARIDAPGGDAATQAELTTTGAVMGTVDYMAPEQALDTRQADAKADIYSLGISLYYLIAGKTAYGGETIMERLLAHRERPIPSLQEAQTTVPKQLDAIFRKMVAKKIEDRYQTMSEVIEALEGLGFGGSAASTKGELATALRLSAEERKRLAATATKKPLGSLTQAVTSEKTRLLAVKIVGGAFATIIAPILVTYLIKYLDTPDPSPNPSAATAATAPLSAGATTTAQPTTPAASVSSQAALNDDGWEALFDGKSLAGWTGDVGLSTVENGVLVITGNDGTVIAPGDHQNVEIEVEFRLAKGGNSGLGIGYAGKGRPSGNGLEIQMIDDEGFPGLEDNQKCGSIYGLVAAMPGHFKRWPQWNQMRVTSGEDVVRVELNGSVVTDTTWRHLKDVGAKHNGVSRTSGELCLVPQAGRSEYRNFRVKHLAQSNVSSLFDGKTLSGWHGDKALWSVEDGAIVGSYESGLKSSSFLASDSKYRNFILKLKFQLNQGNSGVQIRSIEKQNWVVAGPQADIVYDLKWYGCLTAEGMPPPVVIAAPSEDTKRILNKMMDPTTWNEMTVTANGQRVSIQINGHTTVSVLSTRIPNEAGVIALQLFRGKATTVRFKDITLETLP